MIAQTPRHGFTLMELLVVVAVIGLLLGLGFPAFSKAMQRARQAQCASNLRQIGVALNQYADEHNQTYPLGGNDASAAGEPAWYISVAPYLNIPDGTLGTSPKLRAVGVLICPAFVPLGNRATSYGINIYMMKSQSFSHRWSYKRLACSSPAQTILAGEKNYNTDQVYPEDYGGASSSRVERRHVDGANFVMVDGHVEYVAGLLPSGDSRWKWW